MPPTFRLAEWPQRDRMSDTERARRLEFVKDAIRPGRIISNLPAVSICRPERYADALLTVQQIDGLFESLPSAYRRQCGNDPLRFLSLLRHPQFREQLTADEIMLFEDPSTPPAKPIGVNPITKERP